MANNNNNIKIDYSSIVDLIRQNFIATQNDDIESYGNIEFEVADEQDFAKTPHNGFENKLYICVRFSETTVNFNQAEIDINLIVAGLENEIKIVQSFLMDYVSKFNLSVENDITQIYESPIVSTNFTKIYNAYRSVFRIDGTLVIGSNLIRIDELTYWYKDSYNVEQSESVSILAFNDGTENSLNPQPYPGLNGRTKSYGGFQTYTFCITTIPDGSKQLIKDIWAMRFGTDKSHQDDEFIFSLSFKNSTTSFTKWVFKCRSVEYVSRIGENPGINLTFSL